MKSLNIHAFLPLEIGILILLTGIILIFIGNRQSKKKDIDLNKIPFVKPTTKIILGSGLVLIAIIQLFPVIFR